MRNTLRLHQPVSFYLPLQRAEDGSRIVRGACYTSAEVQSDNWVLPYETLKRMAAKYEGAIREMHQPSAAGVAVSVDLDDAAQRCEIAAEIVDDQAWRKCEKLVYKYFSLGVKPSRTLKRADGKYIILDGEWRETSLCDIGKDRGAKLKISRVDGSAGGADEEYEIEVVEASPLERADDVTEIEAAELERMSAAAAAGGHWVTIEGHHVFLHDQAINQDHIYAAGVKHDLSEKGHKILEDAHARGDIENSRHLHYVMSGAKRLMEQGHQEHDALEKAIKKNGWVADYHDEMMSHDKKLRAAGDKWASEAKKERRQHFLSSGQDIVDYVSNHADTHDQAQEMAKDLGFRSTTWDDQKNNRRREKARNARRAEEAPEVARTEMERTLTSGDVPVRENLEPNGEKETAMDELLEKIRTALEGEGGKLLRERLSDCLSRADLEAVLTRFEAGEATPELLQRVETAEAQASTLRTQYTEAQSQLSDVQSQFTQTTEQLSVARADLEGANTNLQRLEGEAETLRGELSGAKEEVQRLEGEIETLRSTRVERSLPVQFPAAALERSFAANEILSGGFDGTAHKARLTEKKQELMRAARSASTEAERQRCAAGVAGIDAEINDLKRAGF